MPFLLAVAAVASWFAIRPGPLCWRALDLRQPTDSVRIGRPASKRVGPPNDDAAVCAEMLAVAASAGCPISEALIAVGETDGAGRALVSCAAGLQRGQSIDDVLDELAAQPGGSWHSLATVLSLCVASGAPPSDSLRRLASQERTRSRRRREQRTRRLPVVLLLPLAAMVLPAFVLVTVVPFAIASTSSVELPPLNDRPVTNQEEP